MFANSLDLVDDLRLTYLHVFPFSPRPGTPAARMPQIARPRGEGARRPAQATGRGRTGRAILRPSKVASVEVVIERAGLGRTPGFAEMHLKAAAPTGAAALKARVTASDGKRLHGEALAPTYAP